MKELFNGIYNYKGYHGNDSQCHLEVLQDEDGKTVAIATELAENKGTSVTNSAEVLATEIVERYNLFPLSLMWIEHYGPMSYAFRRQFGISPTVGKDRYSFISFTWNDNGKASKPEWLATTPERVLDYLEELRSSL